MIRMISVVLHGAAVDWIGSLAIVSPVLVALGVPLLTLGATGIVVVCRLARQGIELESHPSTRLAT